MCPFCATVSLSAVLSLECNVKLALDSAVWQKSITELCQHIGWAAKPWHSQQHLNACHDWTLNSGKREVSLINYCGSGWYVPEWLRYWKSAEMHHLMIFSFYKHISWLCSQILAHREYKPLLFYYTENYQIKASRNKYFGVCFCVPFITGDETSIRFDGFYINLLSNLIKASKSSHYNT